MTRQGIEPLYLHATCVAVDGKGVLITGPSGSGKSALALQLIALGAVLVADDQSVLVKQAGSVFASCPPAISGMIEARGIGLLTLPTASDVPICLVVDLSQEERLRLPELHRVMVLDVPLPCLHKVVASHFPSALMAYMKGSRKEPDERNPQ